ncbi:Uncharacterized conserved protein, DUF924 family [Alcanivorax sp. DSM 26293]|uniref:DUF924 family protein n=1 Tax=Alcanivorax sp. DSM 26293 TaxID=1798238 RepID=UPI00089FC4A7|nr:DUF924 family protein [Alcanivorax sp. DSM 26293]SEF62515.1 Uncharacterized conserved protein, DUF924 family [Alcanivorax sp. DSM 26293]
MFELTPPWQEVLDYWFEDGLSQDWPASSVTRKWFRASAGDDAEIEHRFGAWVEAALQQELVDWERQPQSRLALILLLDQFTRHIDRGQGKAFAGDHRAATLAVEGVSRQMHSKLPLCNQVFFLMPLMHAEDEDLQDLCLKSMTDLLERAPASCRDSVRSSVNAARQHRELISRFGRFPHRNKALGRESTSEELAYLEKSGGFGQ